MARSLRDSIQLATVAGVKEQRRIVYLKTVFISRHDGERAPQNLYYDYWAKPVDDRYLWINREYDYLLAEVAVSGEAPP